MIYNVLFVLGVQQSDSVIYIFKFSVIYIFKFSSLIGYYRISRIVPCAIQ